MIGPGSDKNQINPQQETHYKRESKNSVEEKKYYALKVRKFKFNERPLEQFCNNFARLSLPFASFDILCSWGRGRNIGFHFLKVTTFNISIWGEIWIFHETEAFTKSVRNCRTAHFKTHPTKTRHVQKTYKSTYKSTYKPINNQPINPPLNLHNSKQEFVPNHGLRWLFLEFPDDVSVVELLFRIWLFTSRVDLRGWRPHWQYSPQYYSWVVNLGDWT